MIEINDMFRLRQYTNYWKVVTWVLEEWQPTTYGPQGRWKAISKRLSADQMDALLEQRVCPQQAHEQFRAAMG
jgi:hypothetical protein